MLAYILERCCHINFGFFETSSSYRWAIFRQASFGIDKNSWGAESNGSFFILKIKLNQFEVESKPGFALIGYCLLHLV